MVAIGKQFKCRRTPAKAPWEVPVDWAMTKLERYYWSLSEWKMLSEETQDPGRHSPGLEHPSASLPQAVAS